MSVKAPIEKNFRRAKVKPAAQRKTGPTGFRPSWRVVRIVLSLVLVAYAGYRAFDLVVSASTLQVRKIAVRGNVRLSAGEVQTLVDGLRGSSILTADLGEYRRKLLESPWVANVALRRMLPSTIEVYVEERRPIGLCRLGSDVYRHGMLIDQFGPQYADFDLPIIDGLVRAPSQNESQIDPRRADLAARVIDALSARKSLAARVSQIDVSDAHDAVVLLEGDPALLHLGDARFLERLQGYVDLAPTLQERVPEIDYVDLRFEERMYVKPAKAAGRTVPAPAAKRFD